MKIARVFASLYLLAAALVLSTGALGSKTSRARGTLKKRFCRGEDFCSSVRTCCGQSKYKRSSQWHIYHASVLQRAYDKYKRSAHILRRPRFQHTSQEDKPFVSSDQQRLNTFLVLLIWIVKWFLSRINYVHGEDLNYCSSIQICCGLRFVYDLLAFKMKMNTPPKKLLSVQTSEVQIQYILNSQIES